MKYKLVTYALLFFSVIFSLLAMYGVVQLVTWSNRHQQLSDCQAELKACSEMILQKRHRRYEAKEN